MEKRGFAIGPLDAGQLLRHMRITLNKKNHLRTSFEQAQHVFVANRLVLGVSPIYSRPFHDSSHVLMLKDTRSVTATKFLQTVFIINIVQ